jgi:hypothetical protein
MRPGKPGVRQRKRAKRLRRTQGWGGDFVISLFDPDQTRCPCGA